MIIPARKLSKYIRALEFPIVILEEKSNRIADRPDKVGFLGYIAREEIIGIGSEKRIKHFRMNGKISSTPVRMKFLTSPPTTTRIHYRDSLDGCSPIFCVKRATGQVKDGQKEYEKWDNHLTFAELRRDPTRLISQATLDRRDEEREAKRFQQHPISSSAS